MRLALPASSLPHLLQIVSPTSKTCEHRQRNVRNHGHEHSDVQTAVAEGTANFDNSYPRFKPHRSKKTASSYPLLTRSTEKRRPDFLPTAATLAPVAVSASRMVNFIFGGRGRNFRLFLMTVILRENKTIIML